MNNNHLQGVTTYLAGAGTGKTYQICEEICEAVLDGMSSERVIATTFTKKAAAELKDRVKEHIYENTDLSGAEKIDITQELEKAAIGTVHSLGNQLLKRYSLQLGLSPHLTVLDEDASKRKLNDFLGVVNKQRWENILEKTRPFEIESIQDVFRQLMKEKRLNDMSHDDFRTSMARSMERFREVLAPDGVDEQLPEPDQFRSIAERVRDRLQACDHDYKYVRKAIRKLDQVINEERITWKTLATFSDFLEGRRDEVEEIAEPVRQFAGRIRRHPELHRELEEFMELVTEETIRIENEYQAFKEERGLLDYIDLEAHFLRALRDEQIAEDIKQSFDILLVDEFQDSNPIQLAIFFRLHELVGNSYWVGDEKQSIYGFRDADLQLVRKATARVASSSRHTLQTSYRTHRSLVSIFNDLFTPVFGEEATLLANETSSRDCSVERWCLNVSRNREECLTTAEGVRQLLHESYEPEEIAVLTRTNARAIDLGEQLEELGIPSVVEKPGLLSRRECAVAFSGMKVVADPEDTLARAEIHHLLEDGDRDNPDWIENRLQEMIEKRDEEDWHETRLEWENDPYQNVLSEVDHDLLSPTAIAETVIQKLRIPEKLASWGDPDRRAANLDAFVDFVRTYENEMSEKGRGITLRGFIEWGEEKREEGEDWMPVLEDVDAVTVMTYHSAKGLEWPVVVMTELDKTYEADMWQPRVSGGRVQEGAPLKDREISYWPWPFGEKGYAPYKQKVSGTGLQKDAQETEEGQIEAQKEREEQQRIHYVGMTRASDRLVLTHRGAPEDLPSPEQYRALADFPIDAVLAGETAGEGIISLSEHDTSMRIRHLRVDDVSTRTNPPDTVTDLDVNRPEDTTYVPRYKTPSDGTFETGDVTLQAKELPGPHPFEDDIQTGNWEGLGNAVHAFLAGFPSFYTLDSGQIESIAARCLANHQVADVIRPGALVDSWKRFRTWYEHQFSEPQVTTEVSVTAPLEDSQVVGAIDVLIEEQDQYTIVDHKTKPVPKSLWKETAAEFAGQLYGYRKMLEEQGRCVAGTWIHLPLAGGIVLVKV